MSTMAPITWAPSRAAKQSGGWVKLRMTIPSDSRFSWAQISPVVPVCTATASPDCKSAVLSMLGVSSALMVSAWLALK